MRTVSERLKEHLVRHSGNNAVAEHFNHLYHNSYFRLCVENPCHFGLLTMIMIMIMQFKDLFRSRDEGLGRRNSHAYGTY